MSETIQQKVAFVFPFLVFKKSSGPFNHSFILVAFKIAISRSCKGKTIKTIGIFLTIKKSFNLLPLKNN